MKPGKGDKKNFSRRHFLKTTAVGVSAVALTRLNAKEAKGSSAACDELGQGGGCCGCRVKGDGTPRGHRGNRSRGVRARDRSELGRRRTCIPSGGNVALGGGTTAQKNYGIVDSPDLLFLDLTDWSVVQPNGFPDYRYNDKEIIRAFADKVLQPMNGWLPTGSSLLLRPQITAGRGRPGIPLLERTMPPRWHGLDSDWRTGSSRPASHDSSGIGLIGPQEATARKLGVEILLQHRMTSIIKENLTSGRVLGITVTNQGKALNIGARKGVIIATGGSTNNVNFRRMFVSRLTEEYCGGAGEPYSFQDASGELAAMAIGASLSGAYNQTGEFGPVITKPGQIGCQYGYRNLQRTPGSPIFNLARASGLRVADRQDLILVNQVGLRFYHETARQFTSNNHNALKQYTPGSYLNAATIKYNPSNFLMPLWREPATR